MGWTYKGIRARERVWASDFYADLDADVIDNFAEFGQPFSSDDPRFIQACFNMDVQTVIEMPQFEIMQRGFGRHITLAKFNIVKQIISGEVTLPDGEYTFQHLLSMGKTYPFSRFLFTGLYTTFDQPYEAYVYGSVGFELVERSFQLSVRNGGGKYAIKAEVRVLDDNWDFKSASWVVQAVNPAIKAYRFFNRRFNLPSAESRRADYISRTQLDAALKNHSHKKYEKSASPNISGGKVKPTRFEDCNIKLKYVGSGRMESMELVQAAAPHLPAIDAPIFPS